MIGYIRGKVVEVMDKSLLIVLDSGLGLEVETTAHLLVDTRPSQEIALYIHTSLREDAISLFGFASRIEREVFQILLGVNGIGPKLAMTILSGLGHELLIVSIKNDDIKTLTTVAGVGTKVAGRIVLELKSKFQKFIDIDAVDNQGLKNLMDAKSALVAMGYVESEASKVIEQIAKEHKDASVQDLVKLALKFRR